MKSREKIREPELAEKFIQFFSGGYDVYPEVPAQGIIDIIAFRDPVVIAVECKMQFGFDVLEQAVKNKAFAHYSYIAIPKPLKKFSRLKEAVCKSQGIGVLTYDFAEPKKGKRTQSNMLKTLDKDELLAQRIRELVKPQLNRKIVKPNLAAWMKKSVAGSQSQRMTAFKHTVSEIERLLQQKGVIKVDEALRRIKHHYGSVSSAKSSIHGLCKRNIITSFTMEKGLFKVREQ